MNLVEFLFAPASISPEVDKKAQQIACDVINKLDMVGILAVELFLLENDEILINEIAPRPHNSGHHTIEGSYSSQFDMLWRIMLQLPLGSTRKICDAALVNLIGQEHAPLDIRSAALTEILKIDNAFLHLYGKKENRPGRKMGHVTILSPDRIELVHLANKVRHLWEGKY